jgi:hypothetical protein
MKSDHFLYVGVDWAAPVLLMSFFATFLILIQIIFKNYLMKWGFALQSKEIEVDEDLPNFFKTVKLAQADELISEESNMKEKFGFSFNDGDTIATLDATAVPKKAIQGTPWYQILSNPKYSGLFYYIGAYVNERYKLIEDGSPDEVDENGETSKAQKKTREEQSDLIMFLLNLAYMPDSCITQLEDFNPGWQEKFMAIHNAWKEEFSSKHGREWQFQNGDLEEEYKRFCEEREKQDEVHQKSHADWEQAKINAKNAALDE